MAGYKYPYYSGQKSQEYWTHRAKENLAECFGTTEKVNKHLTSLYKSNLKKLCKSYNELMTPFIKDGEIDQDALQKALVYDAAFIGKKQRLEKEITMFAEMVNKESQERILKGLTTAYIDNVEATLDGFDVATDSIALLDKKAVEVAVRTPFTKDSKEFSERIWGTNSTLHKELRSALSNSIATGRSIENTTRDFIKIFGNTVSNTQRIIRTETLAVYTKSSVNTYKEVGVKYLEVMGEDDACEECVEHDGDRVLVEEAEVGVNVPVWHPNCRCSVKPVIDWRD